MLVACLFVQNVEALSNAAGAASQRIAWDRLKEIRGVERFMVVAAPEFLDATVRMLKKAGNGPGKYIALPPDGLDNLMTRLTEKPLNAMSTSGHDYPVDAPLTVDDVVIFDKCLSPFVSGGVLESCLGPDDTKLTCPGMKETCLYRVPGPNKATVAASVLINPTLGVYRFKSNGEVAFAETGRVDMLQINRPEDMNIAQALAVYGTD